MRPVLFMAITILTPTSVLQKGFDPAMGLFKTTATGELYPNPASMLLEEAETLDSYRFLGLMLVRIAFARGSLCFLTVRRVRHCMTQS